MANIRHSFKRVTRNESQCHIPSRADVLPQNLVYVPGLPGMSKKAWRRDTRSIVATSIDTEEDPAWEVCSLRVFRSEIICLPGGQPRLSPLIYKLFHPKPDHVPDRNANSKNANSKNASSQNAHSNNANSHNANSKTLLPKTLIKKR